MDPERVSVYVRVPADLSHTGKERMATKLIDGPVADLVRALQCGGINMRSSCSGHGNGSGEILLQDGRRLEIHYPFENDDRKSSSAPVGEEGATHDPT